MGFDRVLLILFPVHTGVILPTTSARLYNRKAIRSIRVAVSRTETLNARGGEWQVGAERRGPR